jgi:hypothetical protein
MSAALDAFNAHTQRLVDAVESDAGGDLLAGLLTERRCRIDALVAAVAAGERVRTAEIRALEEQERRVVTVLLHRREEVCQELAALRRGRSAESAYRPERDDRSRFVDRAG